MRTVLLFLTILFLEKTAFAVVRPAAAMPAQLGENQPFKLSPNGLQKTGPTKSFGEKAGHQFFQKKKAPTPNQPHPDVDRAAVASAFFGLAAVVLAVLTVGFFGGGLALVWLACLVFAVAFGIFALVHSTRRKFAARGGILLAVLSCVAAIVTLYVLLNKYF